MYGSLFFRKVSLESVLVESILIKFTFNLIYGYDIDRTVSEAISKPDYLFYNSNFYLILILGIKNHFTVKITINFCVTNLSG